MVTVLKTETKLVVQLGDLFTIWNHLQQMSPNRFITIKTRFLLVGIPFLDLGTFHVLYIYTFIFIK